MLESRRGRRNGLDGSRQPGDSTRSDDAPVDESRVRHEDSFDAAPLAVRARHAAAGGQRVQLLLADQRGDGIVQMLVEWCEGAKGCWRGRKASEHPIPCDMRWCRRAAARDGRRRASKMFEAVERQSGRALMQAPQEDVGGRLDVGGQRGVVGHASLASAGAATVWNWEHRHAESGRASDG